MKMLKRSLAVLLMLCMLLSMVPVMAFAADTQNAESDDYRILHLDCGRKYFSKDWIIALINEMAAAGYTHLELAFGNDGLRFLLDDMSVGSYSDDAVTAAIQAGNEAYYDAGDVNELTQSEMDAIIAHAQSAGISIIPLLNTPGHMDAIITAMQQLGFSSPQYSSSVRTVDVTDTNAVAFTQTLVEKYMDYFASKGCKEFNIGADEYANDTGNPQFSALISNGYYDEFIAYINTLAEYAVSVDMTPMAFNDGIYYNQNTSNGTINENIMVCYWSSGWWGYDVASASYLANKGFKMINTNGDYYFVLTSSGITNPSDSALNFSETTFMGSTVSDPAGSMFCIWCDVPGSATEQEVAAAVRITLRKMAAAMKGTTSYSEEVVSGGFNEDGSINVADTRSWVTVAADDNSGIYVSGYDLTGVAATEVTNLPEIAGAVNVKAWDITPSVDGVSYTENGTVKLPVPEGWNAACLTGFYVENGEAVLVKGTYADGCYAFDMPHFSVAGLAELDYNHLIELTVGESMTELLENVDLTGNTYTPDPAGIANVTLVGHEATAETTVSTTKATVLEDGATYIIRVYNTNYALTSNEGGTTWGDSDGSPRAFESFTAAEADNMWTLEASGSGYKLKCAAGYLNLGKNAAWIDDTGEVFTFTDDSGWAIGDGSYNIDALGGLTTYYCAGGWPNSGTRFDLYKVTTATEASTSVTFTGTSVGETYVTINDEVYKIVVSRAAVNANLVVDGTKTYNDASTNVTVADSSVAEATLSNGTLTITGKTVGTTTVTTDTTVYTVTVTEEDLSAVDPLTIEYWITNQVVTIGGANSGSITASSVYGEAGVDFAALVPASDGADTNPKVLWKGWLLPDGYHQVVDTSGGEDMTTSEMGIQIQKIRYWNGSWQYFNGTKWTDIKTTDQIVAYYMQQTKVTTEITTNVVDWGQDYAEWKEGEDNSWFWGNYVENGSKYVFLDFAVVYEDGTQNPNSFPNDNTWFFHFDGHSATNPRVLGAIVFDENSQYEIWKVTVTDGETVDDTYTSASTFESSYDATTETIVWDETYETEPSIESLSYTANQSGKLIKIYVRARVTEDTLTVVYYDEKFGDTLYSYNINVAGGVKFNNDNFDPDPVTFATNENRIDVSNAGIKNALGVKQVFQTDLTKVPEAVGKYRNDLYIYTGSEISEDGKTLYLYYNINTTVLSPNFVVDFGLPITFELSQLLGEGTEVSEVTDVSGLSARYGTLTYSNGTFTYTPTKILQNVDVLSITLTIKGTTAITNVGVTPATTVYYEQTFLTYDSNWTVGAAPTATQKTEILGSSSYYGYDEAYKNGDTSYAESKATGATATFTFTGTGFELYANSDSASGYVAVFSQGSLNKLYMIDTKLTAGGSAATIKQTGGTYYSLPIISEKELPYGTYTVTIKQTKGTEPIYIDGVRIINTLQDSSVFTADEEDNPDFYQLRDAVLNAIDVEKLTASGYIDDDTTDRNVKIEAVKDMAGQVYNAANGATAIILDESISYGNGNAQDLLDNGNAQDLLDNGPKNELYLYPGQTLVFSVSTARVMQLGLKAPTGSASFTIKVNDENVDIDRIENDTETLTTTVDMFYKIAEKGGTKHTVSITVSEGVLSVTDLKICDDPNAAFVDLTHEDIESALMSVYGLVEEPAYADAVLSVVLKDRTGRELGTVELAANGVVGENAVFTAEQILAAAKEQLPRKYALVDKDAVVDIEVEYGQTKETTIRVGKIVSLRIVFGNQREKKQPFEGGWALWLIPTIVHEEV